MCNQFSPGLPKKEESVKVNIGFPVERTNGWSVGRLVYGHLMTKFSGMGRFTLLRGSAHAHAKRVHRCGALLLSKCKISFWRLTMTSQTAHFKNNVSSAEETKKKYSFMHPLASKSFELDPVSSTILLGCLDLLCPVIWKIVKLSLETCHAH